MRQDNLAPQLLGRGLSTLLAILGQGDNVGDHPGEAPRVLTTHGGDTSNDRLFVSGREINTAHGDAGEEEARIRTVLPNLCDAVLGQGRLDPVRFDHRDKSL